MVSEGFLLREYKEMLLMDDEPASLLNRLSTFKLPDVDKWGNLNRI
jgi:hypothetical protein